MGPSKNNGVLKWKLNSLKKVNEVETYNYTVNILLVVMISWFKNKINNTR